MYLVGSIIRNLSLRTVTQTSKLSIRVIFLVLNPAPLDRIISNVITEYRKSERHYSNVSGEQAFPSSFGGGQSDYVSISLVCG
jgi:hypothetical protein